MSTIFASLEAVESPNIDTDISFEEITQLATELMIETDEMNDAYDEFEEAVSLNSELNESVSSIESLIETIEKHGICKSTILAADSDQEFRKRGILPAVEDVNDVPTNDEHATAAIEGLKDIAKKFWEAIKGFFIKIKDFIVKLFGKIVNVFKKIEMIASKYIKSLKDLSNLNADKLAKKKVSYFKDAGAKMIVDNNQYCSTLIDLIVYAKKISDSHVDIIISDTFVKAVDDNSDETKKLKTDLSKDDDDIDKLLSSLFDKKNEKIFGVKYETKKTNDSYIFDIKVDEKKIYVNDLDKGKKLSDISNKVDVYTKIAKAALEIGLLSKQVETHIKGTEKLADAIVKVAKATKDTAPSKMQKFALAKIKKDSALLNRVTTILIKQSQKAAKIMLAVAGSAITCGEKK